MSRIAGRFQGVEIPDEGSSESRMQDVRFYEAIQFSPRKPVHSDLLDYASQMCAEFRGDPVRLWLLPPYPAPFFTPWFAPGWSIRGAVELRQQPDFIGTANNSTIRSPWTKNTVTRGSVRSFYQSLMDVEKMTQLILNGFRHVAPHLYGEP